MRQITQTRQLARTLALLLLAVSAVGMVGCANSRLAKERDALYVQNQELQDELNRLRAALDASQGSAGDTAQLRARIRQLQAQLAQKPEPAPQPQGQTGFEGITGIQAQQGNGFVTVQIPGDVLFASGKAELRSSSKSTLTQIASVIQNEYAGDTVRVEGYTDSDPIQKSKWKDNLELSLQRAASVHRYLQQEGISPEEMYAAGFGSTHPQGSKEKSRRVEIVVVQK